MAVQQEVNLDKYNDPQNNSLWLEKNTITLPCYSGINVDRVVIAIKKFLDSTSLKDTFSCKSLLECK